MHLLDQVRTIKEMPLNHEAEIRERLKDVAHVVTMLSIQYTVKETS